jgi:hypothetical protein
LAHDSRPDSMVRRMIREKLGFGCKMSRDLEGFRGSQRSQQAANHDPLQQSATKGIVGLWWMLEQVGCPFTRHP